QRFFGRPDLGLAIQLRPPGAHQLAILEAVGDALFGAAHGTQGIGPPAAGELDRRDVIGTRQQRWHGAAETIAHRPRFQLLEIPAHDVHGELHLAQAPQGIAAVIGLFAQGAETTVGDHHDDGGDGQRHQQFDEGESAAAHAQWLACWFGGKPMKPVTVTTTSSGFSGAVTSMSTRSKPGSAVLVMVAFQCHFSPAMSASPLSESSLGQLWATRSMVSSFKPTHWAKVSSRKVTALREELPAALLTARRPTATMVSATSTSSSVNPWLRRPRFMAAPCGWWSRAP